MPNARCRSCGRKESAGSSAVAARRDWFSDELEGHAPSCPINFWDATERIPPLQIGVSQKRPTIHPMEKRRLGKTDMDVPVLGFGGSEIGYEHASPETVAELLNSALDAGLNVIDTAECYHNSEELIGQTVSDRRKEFYLFTKCGHPHGLGEHADWSKDSILKSIERSLDRLKTDRLDLVHLHTCSESELRKGEAIDALQTQRARSAYRNCRHQKP